MGATTRKDSQQKIADNNETMKRVNFMNSPYSVQGTGADKMEGRIKAITDVTSFNTLTTRQRVLLGNKEGYLKTVTKTVDSESLVYVTLNDEKEEVETTLTMAQVIASGSLFVLAEDY